MTSPPSRPDRDAVKAAVRRAIEKSEREIVDLAKAVYASPETGFTETTASRLVQEALAGTGMKVSGGIALTGVKAKLQFSRGGPTVGIIGELDALRAPGHPGADPETGAAHACGHHVQAGMLAGVAIGLSQPEVAPWLSGSTAFLATPAEEFIDIGMRWGLRQSGKLKLLSGKQEMIRLGAFDDVDMAMMVHTSASRAKGRFVVGGTSNAHSAHYVRFIGRASHAGGAPHQGVNALQAAILALSAVNTQRETFEARDQTRVHGIITKGGVAANAVPAEAVYEGRVRGRNLEAVDKVARRVERCYRAGALAVGGAVEIIGIPGYMPLINNQSLARLFTSNVEAMLGPGSVIEQSPEVNAGGSTDMGDLSQIMPVIHPYVAAAEGTGHGVDYLITDYRRAVVDPAVAMAMTVVDLLWDDAANAKAVLADYRAPMTKRSYVKTQYDRVQEIFYTAD